MGGVVSRECPMTVQTWAHGRYRKRMEAEAVTPSSYALRLQCFISAQPFFFSLSQFEPRPQHFAIERLLILDFRSSRQATPLKQHQKN